MFWIGSSLAEFRSDPLWAEYGMHSRVQFRETGDLKALAQGTCLSDRSDILEHKNGQFTQGFSDLVRIVVCVLFVVVCECDWSDPFACMGVLYARTCSAWPVLM